ncbi:MAG: hypothetical protein WC046_01105 [Candidatus Bathyarchaeia archaeon]
MVEITKLFWKKALTSDHFELGEVNSADLDMSNWRITNLYIALSDEATKAFGFRHPYLGKVVVCLPVSAVDVFKEVLVLNKTIDELRNLRQCTE